MTKDQIYREEITPFVIHPIRLMDAGFFPNTEGNWKKCRWKALIHIIFGWVPFEYRRLSL
jgi:hypothetical protein